MSVPAERPEGPTRYPAVYREAGANLRRWRIVRKLGQKALGRRLAVSESYLCLIEHGKRRTSLDFWIRAARTLRVPLDHLVND